MAMFVKCKAVSASLASSEVNRIRRGTEVLMDAISVSLASSLVNRGRHETGVLTDG